ncbi:MAG: DNA mismatch repair endonuclease MutL, partial [Oscillospiraceae bacterium]
MPQIKLLEKNICEQIAAGEVVERPASVVKELCENSIDAGATKIEIELVKNGLERIRVTDNGCGIDRDDIKTAFLRHATSKIASQEDLQHIGTLGFRGEALAAIASVSKVRIVTRTTASNDGVSMTLVGGDESSFDDIGAPTGTSIYVDSLFFNVPARMKFLKKDTAEGNAVQSVVEQLALTYPYISFKLFRDGRAAFVSPGSGDLYSAIFCVLPREISQDMIELQADSERDIKVTGFITRPQSSKPSRTHQYVSVNGRYIKSRSCCAAAEEACRTYVMSGRFPSFIINVDMPLSDVDVNVHPAKTEVRFKNDRDVFSAVYASVKLAVSLFASNITGVLKRQDEIDKGAETKSDYYEVKDYADALSKNESTTDGESRELTAFFDIKTAVQESNEPYFMQTNLSQQTATYNNNEGPAAENTSCGAKDCDRTCGDEFDIRILGEAFETYIFAQLGDSVVVIDKHAAHERI